MASETISEHEIIFWETCPRPFHGVLTRDFGCTTSKQLATALSYIVHPVSNHSPSVKVNEIQLENRTMSDSCGRPSDQH